MASARAFDACESSFQLSNYRHERNHKVVQYRGGGTQVDFAPPLPPPAQLQDHDREDSDEDELDEIGYRNESDEEEDNDDVEAVPEPAVPENPARLPRIPIEFEPYTNPHSSHEREAHLPAGFFEHFESPSQPREFFELYFTNDKLQTLANSKNSYAELKRAGEIGQHRWYILLGQMQGLLVEE
ncbi:uncharacterized protein H6S33_004851 [Morchella sextelata]|uniref:uncharacterized protein n=1 Tax=Morchella sextelata TaxID=1174677 RepID=UPI001D041EF8|nr:uncharacterized protein H6S33_004851 [Morchella sextelata]KAH0605629.1 hypothetical protein H6S33_004851 [Morchella sextelata]